MSDTPSVEEKMAELMKLTVPGAGTPNINEVWRVAKDITALKLNVKYFGYELAKALLAALPPLPSGGPFQMNMRSKPSTQADLEADWSRYWSSELQVGHIIHRKLWEFAFVLQAIWQNGKLKPGMRGLGLGCGEEPLPSYLASKGCQIVATDLPETDAKAKGWAETTQHGTLEKLFRSELVDRATFDKNMSFRAVDMNDLPSDLRDFDFCWSICAFEHLGSIEAGAQFMENIVDVLKPGGLSIHTTEYNFANEQETIDNWSTVLFQRQHLADIARRMERKGCRVMPLDFDVGSRPLDRFIDIPPFPNDVPSAVLTHWSRDTAHIKLSVDGFPTTCFGFVAIKQ